MLPTSYNRPQLLTNRETKGGGSLKKPRAAVGNKVLAGRSQAVVAVGAWVEGGRELREHPSAQASLTEELQEEHGKKNEESLRHFQEDVRKRVAQQAWLRNRDLLQLYSERQVKRVLSHVDQYQLDVFVSSAQPVIWPLNNTEELKRQRQSQFLVNRQFFMNIEREHVRENKEHKKHLKRTASIKAEKEKARMEEERRLERACDLVEAHQKLEERERLIQNQLKLEEGADVVPTKGQQDKPKTVARLIHALRTQLRKQLDPGKETLELPPLCYCGSFWESHPDMCANNCVFHNNPKAYVEALHSAIQSWDLQ